MQFNRTAVQSDAPRLMLAATGSGVGKTTVTCGVLQALKDRGLGVTSFKCGPDYIDPMFHSSCIGTQSRNLDLFLTDEETTRGLLCKNAGSDLSIIEGVMGFYDGLSNTTQASSYHLASATQTPVVLIVGCRGMSLSIAAQVLGYQRMRGDSRIAGVLLNQISPSLYPRVKESVERETGVPVYGYLPVLSECSLESRHLGLVTASEIEDLQAKLHMLAHQVEQTVELDGLIDLAKTAPRLQGTLPVGAAAKEQVRIGVARDRAFCFYYADNLELLKELGAELVPFSPLEDAHLPCELDGLLLGGGYPELYADPLSRNRSMLLEIQSALTGGMPCVAECGGFMLLHQTLEGADGREYPMAGVVPGSCFRQSKLVRFGYCTLRANEKNSLTEKGAVIPAHEFHYWDSTHSGTAFTARKPGRPVEWQAVVADGMLFAGFPHVHWYGAPELAGQFVENCLTYGQRRRGQ